MQRPDISAIAPQVVRLQDPIKDPARFPWHEVKKVEHYRLEVNALTSTLELKEEQPAYGAGEVGYDGASF